MHALIFITKPDSVEWPESMYRAMHAMPKVEGVTRMSESAWLVHLDTAQQFLSQLVQISYSSSLTSKIMYFSEEPKCIEVLPSK